MCYRGCSKENYDGECTIGGRCIYEISDNDEPEYDYYDDHDFLQKED